MALTLDKLEEAQNKLNQVQIKASELNEILVKVREVILRDAQGNVKIDLTATQKTTLLDEYNLRKQALTDAVTQLL